MTVDKDRDRVAADILRRRSEASTSSASSSNVSLRHIKSHRSSQARTQRGPGRGTAGEAPVRGRGPSSGAIHPRRSVPLHEGPAKAHHLRSNSDETSFHFNVAVGRLARTSSPVISGPTLSEDAAGAGGKDKASHGVVHTRRSLISLPHQADAIIPGVKPRGSVDIASSTVDFIERPKPARSSECVLPPVRSRLANGATRTDALKDSFISPSGRTSGAKSVKWKDTWGPGASTVPPDQTTMPKVVGFDVQQTMSPAAFNGFITAAASSWGGREKNKWKKENQDTFILSPDCKGAGGRSDGRGAPAACFGRRGLRHSTGNAGPITAAAAAGSSRASVGDSSACLLAVLDGHGSNGRYVSTFVRDHLLRDVCEEVDINANQGVDLFAGTNTGGASHSKAEATLVDACRRADQALRTAPSDNDIKLSGSTCALAVVTPHAVLTACVGDSRVVLGRVRGSGGILHMPSHSKKAEGGFSFSSSAAAPTLTSGLSGLEAVALTRDHKPDDPREQARILAANGRVARMKLGSGLEVGPPRVFLKYSWTPGLAVSRAFGDLLAHEVGVTSEPEVMTREIHECDKLLVLGTDGVFEHLTNQEVIDIAASAGGYTSAAVSRNSPSFLSFDNEAAARAVSAAARVAWTKESAAAVDDITVVVAHISHDVGDMVPQRLASTSTGRAARMSIDAMMRAEK